MDSITTLLSGMTCVLLGFFIGYGTRSLVSHLRNHFRQY